MTQPLKVSRTELSPVSFLIRNAYVFPDKIAVVHGDRRYTYGQLQERVNRLASGLQRAGLGRQDRVAFLCPNIPAMLEAHFGVPAAGGILVTINTRLSPDEIGYILKHSGARFLFVDQELEGLIKPLDLSGVRVVRVDDTGAAGDPYEDFLAGGSPAPGGALPEDENETISINYTSGTTGRPKGVMYSHRGAFINAIGEILESAMSWDTVYLWTLPMFHCNGWCFPWSLAAVGGTSVCLRRVNAANIFAAIAEHKVTHFCGAPIVLNYVINATEAEKKPLPHPVQVMTAAAPPPAATLADMQRAGFNVTHVYGLTETYGPAVICSWHPEWNALPIEKQAELKSRQGVRYHALEGLAVMDPDTMTSVPADGETMGEIMFRGNIVMKGYLKNPKASAEAFKGGWFHSGDLGVLHPDGYIQLKDRSKDIIISGGENISSIEVEGTIAAHPAVLFAAVVAKPDAKWGETPCAFVELKPGKTATSDEIIAFCRERLAKYKCPRHVVFGPLPKTSTGKIQKFKLREMAKGA
jgi:fatty-acyl-CoA synthase